MKTFTILSFFFVIALFVNCKTSITGNTYVVIQTEYGNMKVLLYNETPKHKENFIKLVKSGYYDSLLFHRIIEGFMIQGGDPDSKNAKEGTLLGNGGPDYVIPAEFNPKLFHKKGVLAAAREGDNENPEKNSSGSQFYIVQGKILTDEELTKITENVNLSNRKKRINTYLAHNKKDAEIYDSIQYLGNSKEIEAFQNKIDKQILSSTKIKPEFIIPDDHKKVYKEIGGTPFLDGDYTVFGEVVEGLDVIDKIASVYTDKNDRPNKNIRMKIVIE